MNPSKPLRIALLTYATKPRGSIIHTLELAEALHGFGHEVCIYALDKDGLGFDRPLNCEVRLISCKPAPANIDDLIKQRIQEFVDYLSQNQLTHDIYHAQDCIGANALALLKKSDRISHFLRTVHHIEDYSSIYLQQCQDHSIRDADLCFCVSQVWQQELQKRYQIQVPLVTNGVNTKHFSAIKNGSETALKQSLGLTGYPIYLTVGGIEPRKNSHKLLQAFAELLTLYPHAQLAIAGGATLFDYQSYREDFFDIATNLGIKEPQLIITGVMAHHELPVLYRCVDAFVFPSVTEGWGLVILEAIASGLPTIVSEMPPFTEFLSSGQALFVDPQSVRAIAEAMQSICQKDLADSIIKASQSILENYSWGKSAKIHLSQYYQLIQNYA